MAIAVEDICNKALRRIGYPTPIGSIYEGSVASRAAIEIYVQARDELMESEDWQFARQEIGLKLLKTAPVGGYGLTPWTSIYPLLPWIYEYAYPSGCLRIRSVRPTPVALPEWDPVPNIFTIANDSALGQKVVLSNLAGAVASFTALIDDPAQWSPEPRFIEALIERLALRFQEALRSDPEAVKARMAEAAGSVVSVADNRG